MLINELLWATYFQTDANFRLLEASQSLLVDYGYSGHWRFRWVKDWLLCAICLDCIFIVLSESSVARPPPKGWGMRHQYWNPLSTCVDLHECWLVTWVVCACTCHANVKGTLVIWTRWCWSCMIMYQQSDSLKISGWWCHVASSLGLDSDVMLFWNHFALHSEKSHWALLEDVWKYSEPFALVFVPVIGLLTQKPCNAETRQRPISSAPILLPCV